MCAERGGRVWACSKRPGASPLGTSPRVLPAGRVLRLFSDAGTTSRLSYAQQLQAIMALCICLGGAILVLHAWISRTFPKNPKGSTALKMRRAAAAKAAAAAAAEAASSGGGSGGGGHRHVALDLEAAVQGLNYCSLEQQQAAAAQQNGAAAAHSNGAAALPPQGAAANAAAAAASSSSSGHVSEQAAAGAGPGSQAAQQQQQQEQQQRRGGKKKQQEAMSIQDAWRFLRRSPQIRCLAVMALAQVRRLPACLYGQAVRRAGLHCRALACCNPGCHRKAAARRCLSPRPACTWRPLMHPWPRPAPLSMNTLA